MANFFKKLKDSLFGASPAKPAPTSRTQHTRSRPATGATQATARQSPQQAAKRSATTTTRSPTPPTPKKQRDPYFIQIGLDFGTAFTKCVCRDLNIGTKTWVHIPETSCNPRLPFLISSSLTVRDGTISHNGRGQGNYTADSLQHVKMALEKVALRKWSDPVLGPFKEACGSNQDLSAYVECCAVYLLGGILASVRADIAQRFPGKLKDDYEAINMAFPVENANNPEVSALFYRILCNAWVYSEQLHGFPPVSMKVLIEGQASNSLRATTEDVTERCYLYPEVSANVQCFIRSRTSREGIYLFSDTGAGTVDQSVFIFHRSGGEDQLTYLHASVLPLGSSHIELTAAKQAGVSSQDDIEQLRQIKEEGSSNPVLTKARKEVGANLHQSTTKTIMLSKQKLIRKDQINHLRVLFGGGGHCDNPYAEQVLNQFDTSFFHPKTIQDRRHQESTFAVGLPIPQDLSLPGNKTHWMNRLTVAYGLSFEKSELANFLLPREVEKPTPEAIWQPKKASRVAPSKDDC